MFSLPAPGCEHTPSVETTQGTGLPQCTTHDSWTQTVRLDREGTRTATSFFALILLVVPKLALPSGLCSKSSYEPKLKGWLPFPSHPPWWRQLNGYYRTA